MYKILIDSRVDKDLSKINPPDREIIIKTINSLASNPRPRGKVKKLKGPLGGWRVRTGNLRILYLINDKAKEATIYKVGYRGGVYR